MITEATRQADAIIEPGSAQHYDRAVRWLRHARDAYRAAGRQADWQSYLRDLRERHGRKYKLMGLLEALGPLPPLERAAPDAPPPTRAPEPSAGQRRRGRPKR